MSMQTEIQKRMERKRQIQSETDRKKTEFEAEIAKISKELEQAEKKRELLKARLWESAKKSVSGGKPGEVAKVNLDFSLEFSKAAAPVDKEIEQIRSRIQAVRDEILQLDRKVIAVEFLDMQETAALIGQIETEIRKTISDIAGSRKISIVINSAAWNRSGENGQIPGEVAGSADYSRITVLAEGGEKGLDDFHSKPEMLAGSYISELNTGSFINAGSAIIREMLLSEAQDLTIPVVSELLKSSGINSKVKEGIIAYLRKILKGGS
ncbi:MAG: hypothetical protein PHQ23_17140 [Candidatus Wallbacteria bacterium]|nr:hypothetical protein [Candidatus Wallbacteria bacterium]